MQNYNELSQKIPNSIDHSIGCYIDQHQATPTSSFRRFFLSCEAWEPKERDKLATSTGVEKNPFVHL
jgi:hypothetical protein